ncbi:uncharacterized protein K441DRAFT_39952 [Cenococcum geophilum 1.58]|uniref:uncharacterized protein n=1 Tax=Cenococcum geophilum 1.58 TaxID=794803 RepID=UPI0035902272|nr:hypothetical protein K441DRAFT_39952 [Cenococcum geophilum 1.58]
MYGWVRGSISHANANMPVIGLLASVTVRSCDLGCRASFPDPSKGSRFAYRLPFITRTMYLDPGTAVLFALFAIPWDAVYAHSWVSVLGINMILNPSECVSPALVSRHFVFAQRDFIKLLKFKISKVSKKEIATSSRDVVNISKHPN